MQATSLSKQQVTDAVLSCADQEEWEQICSTPYSDTTRDEFINKLHPQEFSQAQRILLATYLHLHGALKDVDLASNERLRALRNKLEISEEFAGLIFHDLKRLNKDIVLAGRSPIESILNPNNRVAGWAADVVYRAHTEGGYSKRQKLSGLNSREYEHSWDRDALNALEGTLGVEAATRAFWKYGREQLNRVRLAGSLLKVTENNFPQIYRVIRDTAETINLSSLPDVYLQNGFIGAFTTGVEKTILLLNTGTIGLLSYDELCFVVGHEMGHIKSQHILYHDMAEWLPILGGTIGKATLGIGEILSSGLQLALLSWMRKSEYSADRAGLLACQNVEAATSAFMKIAGAPPKYYRTLKASDFEKQAKEFDGIEDNLGKFAKIYSVMDSTHPWTVMRGHELYKWIDSGEYDKVLKRTTALDSTKLAADTGTYCPGCGSLREAEARFCTKCGKEFISK
jgi:Zn-dependent protease with chaperone function